jgi:hypothetical protein
MTTMTANVITMFNGLPRREQDKVRLIINNKDTLRSELNYELNRSKKSPVLTAPEAKAQWERFGYLCQNAKTSCFTT